MNRSFLFWYPSLLLVLAFVTRMHALWIPVLDIDETQFVGFAQVLLDGGRPYLDSTDTKPPMIYWVVALVLKFFGRNNLVAVHAVTIVWAWATALAIFFLSRRLFDRRTAVFSGLFYILFTAGFEPKFISTSITQFMNLPLVLAVLALVASLSSPKPVRRRSLLILAGLATAVAFNFKYQGGIQVPILLAGLLIFRKSGSLSSRSFLAEALWILVGFVGCVAFIWSPLYSAGVWTDFVTWSLKGSFDYIRDGRNSWILSFLSQGALFLLAMAPLMILAHRAIRISVNSYEKRKIFFILLWLVVTLIPVSIGGRFYGHYFLQLMPPLVILAAKGTEHLILPPERKRWLIAASLLFVLVPMILRFFYPEMLRLKGEETFEVHEKVGRTLREMATGQEKPQHLFVWGFATPIYTFSGFSPSSRFLWTDLLSGRSAGPPPTPKGIDEMITKGSKRAWEAFWEDMAKRPPDFFVDTSPAAIHDYQFFPISRYPALQTWLDTHFTPCREVDRVVIYCRKADI